jgi:hypothetical protein
MDSTEILDLLKTLAQFVIPALCLSVPGIIASYFAYRSAQVQIDAMKIKLPNETKSVEGDTVKKLGLGYDTLYDDQQEQIKSLKEQLKVCTDRVEKLEILIPKLCKQIYQLGGVPNLE